jgi:hypothetical protein
MASRTRQFLISRPEQRVAPGPFVSGLWQNPKAPPAAKYRRPEEPFGRGTAEGSLRASAARYDCSPVTDIGLLRTENDCPTRTNKATARLNQIEITANCPGDKPGHPHGTQAPSQTCNGQVVYRLQLLIGLLVKKCRSIAAPETFSRDTAFSGVGDSPLARTGWS